MAVMSPSYSFSGADSKIYFKAKEGGKLIPLPTLATISVSVYESKSPVRRLGHKAPSGFTGSIRTIGGSMIFIVTESHPIAELKELFKIDEAKYFSHDKERGTGRPVMPTSGATALTTSNDGNPLATLLNPFDAYIIYGNEVGNVAGISIEGIEFISEGLVTSVNDMVTEMVLQFVATDIRELMGLEDILRSDDDGTPTGTLEQIKKDDDPSIVVQEL